MDDKLLVALVAAVAALLGALIPTVVGYLNSKSQRDFEAKRTLVEKQRQLYSDLMISLQGMINASAARSSELDGFDLQRAVVQISIYGDDGTSAALTDYYNALIASAQPGSTFLERAQHQSHQRRILNAMRASMGLQPLGSFELVGIGSAHRIRGTQQ